MAKSLTELSGKWTMSKELSSDVTPVLEIQGVNFVMRKAAASAPVYLEISQKGKEEVRIAQTTTAGIPGINEGEARQQRNDNDRVQKWSCLCAYD